ncbi:MAG TPA: DNA repair protein RadA [bacterium]|nr:DNA repair protein RadA [bacterium]
MAKTKTQFICQNCGSKSPKWQGKCNACGQWNSFVEEMVEKAGAEERGRHLAQSGEANLPLPLDEIEMEEGFRLKTRLGEFDRVLGGGIVPGETVLIGGDPGIGKSTLLLQVVDRLAKERGLQPGQGKCLYVTGEESAQQIKLRAERLGIRSNNLYIFPETDVKAILDQVQKTRPLLTVIDSIQTLFLADITSAPGSVSQVREAAARLTYLAKREKLPMFLIGHVTKEGSVAGPMVLEHMVDAVLYFEGDLQRHYRLLRAVKNRFGSTQEIGIFEMRENGLEEVADASKAFLEAHSVHSSGSVITASLEGTRPLLLEVQALVSPTNFGMPQRRSTGIDPNRLALILAILEKRLGMAVSSQDVFLNLAGGIRVMEPSIDLSVATAIASSFRECSVGADTLVLGELGLSGEVRSVSQIGARLAEAARLGFKQAVIPHGNLKAVSLLPDAPMEILGVKTLSEAIGILVAR